MASSHIALIQATFYQEIGAQLHDAATQVLEAHGCTYEVINVPGCFEIPSALQMVCTSERFDGAITLGCVIRGETTHYDYVCQESARGINQLSLTHHFPVGYGIITAENQTQALVRADATQKNVGGRAAEACLHMLTLKQQLRA